jgi:hypothetical protein
MRPASEAWYTIARNLFGYSLNYRQKEVMEWWVNSESRAIGILGGERSGKSLLASALALTAMGHEGIVTPKTYWVVGPDYLQARPEFTYMFEAFKNANLIDGEPSMPANPAASWTFKTILGHTVTTRSSAEITKLASFSVYGVIMAEAAQQMQEVYLKCLGRVSESRGFLILVGTLERGLPWYQDLFTRWQGANPLGARFFSLPTWSNLHVYPGGREDPEILRLEAEYPPDYFMERFAAEPRRAYNAVIPEFSIEKHVRPLDYDPHLPVELWIDPGQVTYAVLFVQSLGLYTHVLDRTYVHGMIAHDVIPLVMGNRLFQHVDKRQAGVIDIAGTQEHGNKSQVTLWKEIANCSFRSRYCKEEDTIAAVRFRLRDSNIHHEPLIFFNDHFTNHRSPDGTALDVLAEFELWKWPERGFRQNEPRRPVDKNNHAIKALGYGLVDHYGISDDPKKVRARKEKRPRTMRYWVPTKKKWGAEETRR